VTFDSYLYSDTKQYQLNVVWYFSSYQYESVDKFFHIPNHKLYLIRFINISSKR
jgi:hypothetical protein